MPGHLFRFYAVPVLIATTALLASLVLYALWPEWRSHNEPLHSAMEALGALAAVAMARVLFQRGEGPERTKYQGLALGFLSMGLLQGFHAISSMGNGFILLRGMASLFGGIGFAAACLPESDRRWAAKKKVFWSVAVASIALGLVSLLFPDRLPELLRNGEFSPTAVAPKALASLLFFGAAVRFFIAYHRSGSSDDYLFGCLSLLFALSEVMFNYSRIWDSVWWFWHFILLIAYLWVLAYLSRDYLQTISSLKTALLQTKRAETALRESEQQLRVALEERERIARDLHDGIIQSIYAIGLSLNGCRRVIGEQSQQAAQQLAEAIDDLNVVIRDVRNYIIGLEPQVSSPEELESSLASMARLMGTDPAPSFRLRVDPEAARRLSSEQAMHMLYIAKEAMSNSLRHARANSGMLSLDLRDGHVRLQVEDDGIGFDPSALPEQGHGLRNILARSQKLGARCDIISTPQKGTQIIVDIPIEGKDAAA
jgi:signal transduction histidine kinase